MPGRASTTTSLYSDDPTEVPPLPTTYGYNVREGKLIDYDDPEEGKVINPTDKLRELLNQMRKEVEISRPVTAYTDTYAEGEEVHTERQGQRVGGRRDWMDNLGPSSPPRNRHGEEEEEEEQSPPTPPPRIGNPYSARRGERRNSPNLPPPHPGRLPSRAAVLRNSTSRSTPSPEPINLPLEVKSPPTRLEAFLASNTHIPPVAESSTSPRTQNILSRRDSGSSTSSSRKGKDRAISPLPVQEAPNTITSSLRRNRFRQTPPPESETDEKPGSRKRPQTPRRISVDLAPEDISSFARNAGGLEVRGEVELDLDEGLSAVGWEESSQSIVEESLEIPLRSGSTSRSPDRRERSRTLQTGTSPAILQEGSLRSSLRRSHTHHSPILSHETNLQSSSRHHPSDSPKKHDVPPRPSRRSQYNSQPSPSPPLPALPEPDISAQSDTSEIDTYSSRRAALFRSTSRSASTSASTSTVKSGSQTPSQSFATATGLRSRLSNSARSSVERSQEVSEGDILPRRSPLNKGRVSPQARVAEESQYRSPPEAQILQTQARDATQDVPSRRTGYTPPRRIEDIPIPTQDPIQVNIALTPPHPPPPSNLNLNSTPSKVNANVSTLPTPKPPGAWQSTPKPKVRFNPSPLSRYSPTRPETPSREGVEGEEGVSIHRLRVSPRRSPKSKIKEKEVEEVGNGSFLGRLAGNLSSPLKRSRLSIPPRSTTFSLHTPSLEQAKSATTLAEQNLLITQKQWLEALSAINAAASTSGNVVRKGWGWGTWVLWGMVEVLILWSVFRMTIDYATSLNHISTLDPFHPLSLPFRQTSTGASTWSNGPLGSISLEIPIPSALQTLVGRGGGNANFFDLIESWGVWSRVGNGVSGGGGGRMLGEGGGGGVPS
ncbi:hypothetical protein I302_106295 [Kwoniella bestiolae CBS 10118]|uniref:Uncharacterized protein n=1 Tax=Kwoniella bestiolae CBS 10118 TaxID=1296100 RepID=A0A1B9G3N2_9TREE|nr:hypothetical protein I302_05418 [Kwoniella bestiolae CBS 10118]OCF25598.1 hypothetical protein I302_05418 [Kwoniella bestiolae CBS 10118]